MDLKVQAQRFYIWDCMGGRAFGSMANTASSACNGVSLAPKVVNVTPTPPPNKKKKTSHGIEDQCEYPKIRLRITLYSRKNFVHVICMNAPLIGEISHILKLFTHIYCDFRSLFSSCLFFYPQFSFTLRVPFVSYHISLM